MNGIKKYIFLVMLAIIAIMVLGFSFLLSKNATDKSVQIISASQAKETNPNHEYIVLKVSPRAGEKIYLSDLYLENNDETRIKIPKASALPSQGKLNTDEKVVISSDASIIISSGESPLGVSFRENKCSGYLGQFQNYYPEIEKTCPSQTDTVNRHDIGLLPDCRSYIESLPICETKLYDFPDNVATSCQVIVRSYIHYNACVEAYSDDSDFYLPIWRLYLNRTKEF